MVLIVFTLQAENGALPPYHPPPPTPRVCFFFNSLDFFRSPFLSLAIVNVNPSLSKSCFVSLAKLTRVVWYIINCVYSAAGNHSISHSTPANVAHHQSCLPHRAFKQAQD